MLQSGWQREVHLKKIVDHPSGGVDSLCGTAKGAAMSCQILRYTILTCLATLLSPAARADVDFARDVKPLFERHCYECHGAKQQKNGFRLDRRSRAMAGVVRANIIPGMSSSSRLYRRIFDSDFGPQMPLEDTLSEQ